MRFHLSTDEVSTLRILLNFSCGKLAARVGAIKTDQWDHVAVHIALDKVQALRNKLFPDKKQNDNAQSLD